MAVMVFMLVAKTLHKHSHHYGDCCQSGISFAKADIVHGVCNICEFQLAGDVPFDSDIELITSPVHVALTYGRLLTSINPDRLAVKEGRGPPRV